MSLFTFQVQWKNFTFFLHRDEFRKQRDCPTCRRSIPTKKSLTKLFIENDNSEIEEAKRQIEHNAKTVRILSEDLLKAHSDLIDERTKQEEIHRKNRQLEYQHQLDMETIEVLRGHLLDKKTENQNLLRKFNHQNDEPPNKKMKFIAHCGTQTNEVTPAERLIHEDDDCFIVSSTAAFVDLCESDDSVDP